MITPTQARDFWPRRVYAGGYDREVIDRFIADLTESYANVWQERDQLRGAVNALERELVELRAREADSPHEYETLLVELEEYRQLERRLRQTLLSAERTAEQSKADARRESEQALRKARARAQKLVTEAENERDATLTDAKNERDATLSDAQKRAAESVQESEEARARLEAKIRRLEDFVRTSREDFRERLLAALAQLEDGVPVADAQARSLLPQPFEGLESS